MTKNNYTDLIIITLLTLGTLYNFVPEPAHTHVCIVDDVVEMSMYCDRLSSTGRTCYPNPDNRAGSKLCETEWQFIHNPNKIIDKYICNANECNKKI
jgi:hypothetical protein